MLNIGEFARFGGVSVRMLRHYDALGLVVPTEVDPQTGYRRYAPELLAQVHQLVALKELGFGLERIGNLLDCTSTEELRTLLAERRGQLAVQIEDDQRRLTEVERRLRLIEGKIQMEFEERSLPAVRLAQLTGEVAEQSEIAGVVAPLARRVSAAYDDTLPGLEIAWYHGHGDRIRLGAGVEENGEIPAGLEIGELAASPAIVMTYRGPIARIGEGWQALASQITALGREPVEPCREVYHSISLDDSEDWVIELQQPVR
jgi:DNA-binding transcriptional MerR regulator